MARTKKKGHGGKKSKVVIPILCSFCLVVEEFALCETWFAFWQLSLWKAGSYWLKITFFACASTTLFPRFYLFYFSQKKQTSRGLKLAAKFAVFVSLHFLCFFRAAISLFFFLSLRKEMVPEDCILVVATKLRKNVLGGGWPGYPERCHASGRSVECHSAASAANQGSPCVFFKRSPL
jgi:hypothetical protein